MSPSRKALLAIPVVAVVAAGFLWFRIRGPVEIVDGVFRSAQPSARALVRASENQGIRSVINLRGPNAGLDWYDVETETAKALGLEMIDLPFETFEMPPVIETRELVRSLTQMDRPILMHCESGIDRAGWASAIVLVLAGSSVDEALDELTWSRGHVCRLDECPFHRFFASYQGWLSEAARNHDVDAFREWVDSVYAPGMYRARLDVLASPDSVDPGSELEMKVVVHNLSPDDWRVGEDPSRGVRLGARMLGPIKIDEAGALRVFREPHTRARDVFRDETANDVAAGAAFETTLRFRSPSEPGSYWVQIDMVDEQVAWFSDWGEPGLLLAVEVVVGGQGPGTVSTD